MTNGKRNRTAGSNWERDLVQLFRSIGFPYVVTTRSESRSRDAQKIDLINKDEFNHGRLPYNVQAKNVKGHLKYAKVLGELPKDKGVINVVLHKQTEKKNNRFVTVDKFAILHLDDFIDMVKRLKEYEQKSLGSKLVQPIEVRVGEGILPPTKGEASKGV